MPRKSWWARLPFGVRMAAGASALLILVGGGAAGVLALLRDHDQPRSVTTVGDAAATGAAPNPPAPAPPVVTGQWGAEAARTRTSAEADRTATRDPVRPGERTARGAIPRTPVRAPAGKAPGRPAVTTRTEMQTRPIPYATRTVHDPLLPVGTHRVQTPGVAGVQTLRYLVTLIDGRPADRRLVASTVTRPPRQQVVAVGTGDSGQTGTSGHGSLPDRVRDHRVRDHRGGDCDALDLCGPLGWGACPGDDDRRLEDEGVSQIGANVAVDGNSVGVLSGSGC